MKIFDHTAYEYRVKAIANNGINNGAYWYSREIIENIIPRVTTDRPWVTVNVPGRCYDHAIVFIHNNNHPEWYKWLKRYKDLVLVCGVRSTVEKMHMVLPMHHVIYLPLSIDTKYVEQFETKKTKKCCFAGRGCKKTEQIPNNCDILENIPRDELLKEMAKYEKAYAVGRCALEAKVLNCEIGIYDPRYPEDIWEVYDNSEAALLLQKHLDFINAASGIINKKEEQCQ